MSMTVGDPPNPSFGEGAKGQIKPSLPRRCRGLFEMAKLTFKWKETRRHIR